MTETATSLSKLTEMTMKIMTTKSPNEKMRKSMRK